MVSESLVYSRGMLSVVQVQDEIARFWNELGSSSEIRAELGKAGFQPELLSDIQYADSITVRVDSSGADPASVLLIVAFAPTANRALRDMWEKILLPRILRRWGDDAVGEQKRGQE